MSAQSHFNQFDAMPLANLRRQEEWLKLNRTFYEVNKVLKVFGKEDVSFYGTLF